MTVAIPFLETGVRIITDQVMGIGRRITVENTNAGYCLQAYLAGHLVAVSSTPDTTAIFDLPGMLDTEFLQFIAVAEEYRDTDFFGNDIPVASRPSMASHGNRITVSVMAVMSYGSNDVLTVQRSDAGGTAMTTTIWTGKMFIRGSGAVGWGLGEYGEMYGYDASNGPGYGAGYGFQYGIGCKVIEVVSQPLPPGVYLVTATVTDPAGNVSSLTSTSYNLVTYARPAAGLTLTSYTVGSDTLALAWTASPDIA